MFRTSLAVTAAVALLFAASESFAQRPNDGGLFGFDATDEVEVWDEPTGRIRVHYSVSGPNVTVLDDTDNDNVPDFAQDVAITTADVLDFFESELGVRRPVSEAELELGPLGGSGALDVYLLDFGGAADGSWGVDACDSSPLRCAGYFAMENDFVGYNYPSLHVAVEILTSHELFHGVAYAYTANLPVWFSEGTAVWAEQQYDPESPDFRWFAQKYFDDASRSIDRPPGGPVPTFAYSTGIFFDFLSLNYGVTIIHDFLSALDQAGNGEGALDAIESVLGGSGELQAAWLEFVTWNLATGPRAGALDGYPYATDFDGITASAEGSQIDDENRFYPLAASYFRLDHGGGPLWFGAEEAASDVYFQLHPVQNGGTDGPVEPAVATWTAAAAASFALDDGADFPAGGYWLIGTKPVRAIESSRIRFCLGSESTALDCAPALVDPPGTDPGGDGGCSTGGTPERTGLLFGMCVFGVAFITRRRSSVAHG